LGDTLSFISDQHSVLTAVSHDKSLRRRVEADLARLEKEALRFVQSNRRAILAVADALAETRYLSGEAIRGIVDAIQDAGSDAGKIREATKRTTR
jgi:ATP-dependent Zn protease